MLWSRRHLALLDAAIHQHSDVLFKTVGDAVQAGCPTARYAVAVGMGSRRSFPWIGLPCDAFPQRPGKMMPSRPLVAGTVSR